jgi:hypothetical protein
MTYEQLLAAYRTATGKDVGTADQNNAFNAWVNQQGAGSTTDGSGSTLGGLITPTVTSTTPVASVTTVPGSNYNQVQNANQTGTFGTVGTNTTDTSQNQNTTQNTNQNTSTTGTQNSTGTQNQNTTSGGTQSNTGVQNTTGTSANTGTTNAIDTLGFGKLLQNQAGMAGASDASRNAFLTDTMNTGGSALGSQVDQAVRNSLSGPQMNGAGDSARARAAGYAGAQIGRNNMDQRLAASNQLAGPTGLTTLSSAANPFIGQSTSNVGVNNSTTGSSGTSTNTGFSNLIGSNTNDTTSNQNSNTTGSMTGTQNTTGKSVGTEASTGSTAAGSSQAASGVVPQGQPVKTGGCVICTVGLELGLFRTPRALRKAALHKLEVETGKYRSALRGYFHFFTPLARWLLSHPKLAKIGMPIAKAVVYEELRVAGMKLPWKFWPWFHHTGWHNTCRILGFLGGKDHVDDLMILTVARKHNVCFNIKEVV